MRLGERLGEERLLRKGITNGGIRFMLAQDVPDSGQEHLANGDDGFLVATMNLNTPVADTEFGVILGSNHCVGDLDKDGFKVRPRLGDTGRFDGAIAFVVTRTTTRP